jgi:hypothetical protein
MTELNWMFVVLVVGLVSVLFIVLEFGKATLTRLDDIKARVNHVHSRMDESDVLELEERSNELKSHSNLR